MSRRHPGPARTLAVPIGALNRFPRCRTVAGVLAMPPPRTFLLPGTGADGRMFPDVWSALPGVVRVEWPRGGTWRTIPQVADHLIREQGITAEDTLVGVSLGGMVACEIANRIPVAGLVLVGSCTSPAAVSPVLRAIRPLIRVVPLRLAQALVRDSRRLEFRMFADADHRFVRAMCLAIFRWEGLRPETSVRPVTIHGRRDRVIPRVRDPDVVIDGGHMIAATHPRECTDAILRGSRRR